jgi:hypothetical protein
MSRNPYFRSRYPQIDKEISQGYSDMGKSIQKFLGSKVILYTLGIVLVGFVLPYTTYFILLPFLMSL